MTGCGVEQFDKVVESLVVTYIFPDFNHRKSLTAGVKFGVPSGIVACACSMRLVR